MPRRSREIIVSGVDAPGAPLTPLKPYVRCTCNLCRECKENEKWDRVFATKFAAKEQTVERGMFRSPLSDL